MVRVHALRRSGTGNETGRHRPASLLRLPRTSVLPKSQETFPRELRWQQLPRLQRLAQMLVDHLDGILNYCRTKVRFGVVEAFNGKIKTPLEGAAATKISP